MFKDLQKGYSVSVLDKSAPVLTYKIGTVVDVSAPRFENKPQVAGQIQPFSTDRVIDLTVEIDGKTSTYVVHENSNIASASQITLACDTSLIGNEVRAIMKRDQDEIDKYETRMKNVESCKSILGELNPELAQSKVQGERIDKLEKSIADIGASIAELHKLLATPSKSSKQQ